MNKSLNNLQNKKVVIDFLDIKGTVDNSVSNVEIEWDNDATKEKDLKMVSDNINTSGPVAALEAFAKEYMASKDTLEFLNNQKSNEERQAEEDLRPSLYDTKPSATYGSSLYGTKPSTTFGSSLYGTKPSATYGSSLYGTIPVSNGMLSKEDILRRIREEGKISDSLLSQIIKTYKKLDGVQYYGEFYEGDNIQDIYNFDKLFKTEFGGWSKPNNLFYNDMVQMGYLAADITFKDLMYSRLDSSTNIAELVSLFRPHDALERYEYARARYMKYYNKLNANERQIVDGIASADQYSEYRYKFGITDITGVGIATVDQIKTYVNNKIKNTYIEKHEYDRYITEHDEVRYDNIEGFYGSLRYMSKEDISSLYLNIREKRKQLAYGLDESAFTKQNAAIQKLFAEAIKQRLINTANSKALSGEERKIKDEKDLAAICNDYFHEKPIFDLNHIKLEEVEDGYGEARAKSSEAINAATRRYYGLNLVAKALASLDYSKLEMLAKKDVITPQEMEEVNRMFGGK